MQNIDDLARAFGPSQCFFQVVEQQSRGPVHWHGLIIATPPINPLPTAAHDVET